MVLIYLSLAEQALAQNPIPCTQKVDESPAPLGVKLGMTAAEAGKTLGRIVNPRPARSTIRYTQTRMSGEKRIEERITAESIGEGLFAYYPYEEDNRGALYLRFWREKLYTIVLEYDARDFIQTPSNEHTTPFVKKFQLPNVGWDGMTLKCDGFYFAGTVTKNGIQIELTDSQAKEEIRNEAEKVIESQWRTLRPSDFDQADPSGKGYPPVLKRRHQ